MVQTKDESTVRGLWESQSAFRKTVRLRLNASKTEVSKGEATNSLAKPRYNLARIDAKQCVRKDNRFSEDARYRNRFTCCSDSRRSRISMYAAFALALCSYSSAKVKAISPTPRVTTAS